MVDLSDVETCDPLELGSRWVQLCDELGMASTRINRARIYWIGIGSRDDVMRRGLAAYRDATTDAGREDALLAIVDQYDADVRASANS